ncbi:uncharacterized protein I206_102473 [Kwoniella pini CBS 10737]|uniref:Uncharacterized protein n=1 Tax=Kwoniella pini CBS 10737 TaxID=1296096 RepID=A0A1B9I5G8_9TREE|nr:uncharacterized protein I206_02824 [Kwoniella pini CBS 10737]OCF50768.1 hypothetical protein I206_02824 [Kwoniella pini CBS 10737]
MRSTRSGHDGQMRTVKPFTSRVKWNTSDLLLLQQDPLDSRRAGRFGYTDIPLSRQIQGVYQEESSLFEDQYDISQPNYLESNSNPSKFVVSKFIKEHLCKYIPIRSIRSDRLKYLTISSSSTR